MVEIFSKNIGEVKDKLGGEFKKTFEDYNEDYIKLELRIDGE